MSYCKFVNNLSGDRRRLHLAYHDNYYGFPIHNDDELFERLILEINQAGLNWETILKKEKHFRRAYNNFDIKKIARYSEKKKAQLLTDINIIRNRLKIEAAIHNAKVVLVLQKEYGSFEKWLARNYCKTGKGWIKLFKKHFKFVGGEIVREFLLSIGYLEGAHDKDCPIYKKILKHKPMWLTP